MSECFRSMYYLYGCFGELGDVVVRPLELQSGRGLWFYFSLDCDRAECSDF